VRARKQRARHHVLQHAHARERLHDLKGSRQAAAGSLERALSGHIGTAEEHVSPGGALHAGDHVDEGGLAGAVGPDQRNDLALLERKADLPERLNAPE